MKKTKSLEGDCNFISGKSAQHSKEGSHFVMKLS